MFLILNRKKIVFQIKITNWLKPLHWTKLTQSGRCWWRFPQSWQMEFVWSRTLLWPDAGALLSLPQTLSSSELRIWPHLISGDLNSNLVTLCLDIISGFTTGSVPPSSPANHDISRADLCETQELERCHPTCYKFSIRNVMYPVIRCLNPRLGQTCWSIRGPLF